MTELHGFNWNPLSVAPMVGHTHRHGRFMFRLLAPKAQLFTEMLVDNAILNGRRPDLLRFHADEHPVIAQLAGSDPSTVAEAAHYVERAGFDGINLNIGCPSTKSSKGGFGACLFLQPSRVADIVAAVRERVSLPVSIKCRLGTETSQGYENLRKFVETVMQAGTSEFIVHARIAVLHGMNTAQNRSIPPLNYEHVQRLKTDIPSLHVVLNGGITDRSQVHHALEWADGVMLGRLALTNPRALFDISNELNDTRHAYEPFSLIRSYCDYMNQELINGVHELKLVQPLLNLFNGWHGAKKYRRHLTENIRNQIPLVKVVLEAAKTIRDTNFIHAQTDQRVLLS